MAKKTPIVREKLFSIWDPDADRKIYELDLTNLKDWEYWQNFLNDKEENSFRFESKDGASFTAVKEMRSHFGKGKRPVWIAHKRLDGKLRRKYIGVSDNCTYEKLKSVAFELSQRKFPS